MDNKQKQILGIAGVIGGIALVYYLTRNGEAVDGEAQFIMLESNEDIYGWPASGIFHMQATIKNIGQGTGTTPSALGRWQVGNYGGLIVALSEPGVELAPGETHVWSFDITTAELQEALAEYYDSFIYCEISAGWGLETWHRVFHE